MKNKTIKSPEEYRAEFEQDLDYLFELVLKVNMGLIDVQQLEDHRKAFTAKYGTPPNK